MNNNLSLEEWECKLMDIWNELFYSRAAQIDFLNNVPEPVIEMRLDQIEDWDERYEKYSKRRV